ncbi:MAG TPA: hypothetical protein VFE25_08970 [Opitutaceae bacterium]|jgi:hypothetical protein|nr:hypothetical protein [Opitutaceae bacterium]
MNPASSVPLILQCIAALVVMTEGIFLVSWYARQAERIRPASSGLIAVFLGLWFACAFILGDRAHFPLPNESLRLPLSGLVSFGPFLVALLWAFGSKAGREINAAVVPAALIGVQAYRMAGILFLFPNYAYGVLAGGFAWPAGVGDFITGLAAPFVAMAVYRRHKAAMPLAVAWNLFGILDLIVAPTTATLFHVPILAMYPLSLVPLFVGPPMGILTHVLSLRSLALNRGALRP